MIVTVSNQKGGVGKTTVAVNLASCFARDGKDVLLVDADEQGSALDWKSERPQDVPPVQTVGLPVDNLHKEIAVALGSLRYRGDRWGWPHHQNCQGRCCRG